MRASNNAAAQTQTGPGEPAIPMTFVAANQRDGWTACIIPRPA